MSLVRTPSRTLVGGRSARTLAIAAVAATSLAVGVAPASAHTHVVSTTPGAGKTASTRITTVLVTFSGQIRTGSVRVVGRGGKAVTKRSGRDARNVKRLRATLKSGLKAGTYTARWSITGADGHRQQGSFSFRLKAR